MGDESRQIGEVVAMTFLEALSYIPKPAPSCHDVADHTNSSDLDADEQPECETPAARYWAGLEGEED